MERSLGLALLTFSSATYAIAASSAPSTPVPPPVPPPPPSVSTNILIAYSSRSNWTNALASHVETGALSTTIAAAPVSTRLRTVDNVSCDDLNWADGIALGTPVYWGSIAAPVKALIDDVQDKCFGWPVTELAYKVGAAFTTGGHESSGKDGAIQAIHAFYYSVQMVVVGGEYYGSCHMGACATHFPDDAAATGITTKVFGTSGAADGEALGKRLATVAYAMKPTRLQRYSEDVRYSDNVVL